MTFHRIALVAVLVCTSGCGMLLGTWEDEPSVVSVHVRALPEGDHLSLNIATTAPEGDWSYGAFAQARVDGLQVATEDGAAVQTGPPAFTPASGHGGDLRVPLATLDPGVAKLTVSGEFFGLDAAGQEVVRWTFKQDVKLTR